METFAAVRLDVDSWRWHGVPFYIRADKCHPVTCTEIVCRLRKPPGILPGDGFGSNYMRFRISPDVAIAMGMTVMSPGDSLKGEPAEMVASRQPGAEEMDAYERVLKDAMAGDATLFAREDYVEEAWRIVDPLLKEETPVYQYEPGEWGPKELERLLPPGGWVNPIVNHDASQLRTQEEPVLQ
jgi:glucose-6-phosphate 1-dehydrogenase